MNVSVSFTKLVSSLYRFQRADNGSSHCKFHKRRKVLGQLKTKMTMHGCVNIWQIVSA